MITATSTKEEILAAIGDAALQLKKLAEPLSNESFNKIPYKNSWTAGQLLRHVTKSVNGMAGAMQAAARPADRDVAEKVSMLAGAFLDFSTKMNSPAFIIPEDVQYEKQESIAGMESAFQQFYANTNSTILTEIVDGLPFGPVTKLELLHFTLYHTQRHLNQLNKICDAIETS